MLTPTPSPITPARPLTLAEAVERARWPRNHATARLEPHREEVLRLRQGGASIESLVGGLRLLGIEVGRETIRLWLNRELGHKPAKQRKPREKREVTLHPTAEKGVLAATPPAAAVAADAPKPAPLPSSPDHSPGRTLLVIEPGETFMQAWRRRLAVLDAEKAVAKAADVEQSGSRIARDDI